jgi:peptide/nickel transport system permease protein
MMRMLRSKMAIAGICILILFSFAAITSDWIAPKNPFTQKLSLRNHPPGTPGEIGFPHLLGTDYLGRDVLSRVLLGMRISLLVGLGAIFVGAIVGVALGAWSGFFGGRTDAVIMRLADIQLSFPAVLLAITWVAFIGTGIVSVIIIIAITSWVQYARVARGMALSLRERPFVEGARAIGLNNKRIILRYILPNLISPIIVVATLQLGRAVILESTLSFLGLGVQPPLPSLGSMLADGRKYLDTAWWVATFPGLAIMVFVLSVNLLGDALRDILDPRMVFRRKT